MYQHLEMSGLMKPTPNSGIDFKFSVMLKVQKVHAQPTFWGSTYLKAFLESSRSFQSIRLVSLCLSILKSNHETGGEVRTVN